MSERYTVGVRHIRDGDWRWYVCGDNRILAEGSVSDEAAARRFGEVNRALLDGRDVLRELDTANKAAQAATTLANAARTELERVIDVVGEYLYCHDTWMRDAEADETGSAESTPGLDSAEAALRALLDSAQDGGK